MAAVVLVGIDPVDKIAAANDTKVIRDIDSIAKAAEFYTVTHNAVYPATLNDMVTNGDLKVIPKPPSGYGTDYTYAPNGTGGAVCTPTDCIAINLYAPLKSKKYSATPYWHYTSNGGRSCAASAATLWADC